MKNFLKKTQIGKFIQRYLDKRNEAYEKDFELTFLKMEGKTWDQHMKDISEKSKK